MHGARLTIPNGFKVQQMPCHAGIIEHGVRNVANITSRIAKSSQQGPAKCHTGCGLSRAGRELAG